MSVEVLHVASLRSIPEVLVTADGALRIETIADPATFAGLRTEWNGLLEASSSDTVFLTWEWLHTWWRHLSKGARLAVLVVRRGTEIVAIAPFASGGSTWLGAPRISFLGTGQVGSDYLDLMVRKGAEDEAIPRIAAHLAQVGARLDLAQLRLTSSAGARLARELRLLGCPVRAARTHRCPYIDLRGVASFETFLASLGSEQRYNFKRKLRRLETQHGSRLERVASEERRRELLPVLFELHRQRWSERGGSDGLVGPDILEFHDAWTRLALDRGWLRLFVLWLGESAAASLYGFRYGSVFYFYQSGFDPRFARLSVGLVTMGLAIRSAIEEGAAEFDLLHGEEAYKLHWAREARRLGRVQAFPSGPLGLLASAGCAGRETLRGLARRLPGDVVARIAARRGGRHAPTR